MQSSSTTTSSPSPSSPAPRHAPHRLWELLQRRRRPSTVRISGELAGTLALARGEPLPSYSSRRISFGCIGLDHLTEEVLPDLHRPDSF
jgi:hypothetical protein